MTIPTLLDAIVEALRSAGATEEIIAAAVKADGESRIPNRAKEAARKRRKRGANRPPDTVRCRDGASAGHVACLGLSKVRSPWFQRRIEIELLADQRHRDLGKPKM